MRPALSKRGECLSCAFSLDIELQWAWSRLDGTLAGVCATIREIDPARPLNPSIICMRGRGILHALSTKDRFPPIRAARPRARTGVPSTLANAAARAFGETRCAPSQFDYTLALPTLFEEFCGQYDPRPSVETIGDGAVQRLQIALDESLLRRGDCPRRRFSMNQARA